MCDTRLLRSLVWYHEMFEFNYEIMLHFCVSMAKSETKPQSFLRSGCVFLMGPVSYKIII